MIRHHVHVFVRIVSFVNSGACKTQTNLRRVHEAEGELQCLGLCQGAHSPPEVMYAGSHCAGAPRGRSLAQQSQVGTGAGSVYLPWEEASADVNLTVEICRGAVRSVVFTRFLFLPPPNRLRDRLGDMTPAFSFN